MNRDEDNLFKKEKYLLDCWHSHQADYAMIRFQSGTLMKDEIRE